MEAEHLAEPTDRQLEVARLIAEGLTKQQIADALLIEIDTVKRHTTELYMRLGCHNAAQAIAILFRRGLL